MDSKQIAVGIIAVLMSFGSAMAQDNDSDGYTEATIRLMGAAEADLPDAVTKEISLPESLRDDSAAVENAARGIETANENRRRREAGLTTADQARERGAEMVEDAMENRENRGRSEDRPDRPDLPNPANDPGPPGGA